MDTGLRRVASIWFQCVVPMPLADGPMMTWPTLSPRPSLLLSATVTRRDRSWGGSDMGLGTGCQAPAGGQVWLPESLAPICVAPRLLLLSPYTAAVLDYQVQMLASPRALLCDLGR